MQKGIPNCKN